MINSLVIFGGIVFNVLASFLLKFSHTDKSSYIKIFQFEINLFLILSAFLYFCAFGLYFKSLQGLDLSRAQPIFTIGTMLGVGSLGILVFDEPLDWKVIVSYSAFIFGILILAIR